MNLAPSGITALGSLGGDASDAYDVNEAGQIVGSATTASGQRHAFLWSASTGRMQDLGTLGGTFSEARFIDDQGRVLGRSSMPQDDRIVRGFIWDSVGGMREIPPSLPGYNFTQPVTMSQNFLIAGRMDGDYQVTRGFVFDTQTGVTRDLGSINGGYSAVESMNESGTMVGFSSTGCCYVPVIWAGATAPLQPLPLDPSGGGYGSAEAINASGVIVGLTDPAPFGNPLMNATVWSSANAAPQVLGTLAPFDGSFATGLNDQNLVVGGLRRQSDGLAHGALWDLTAGTTTDLGALVSGASSGAVQINNGTSGTVLVVGWSQSATSGEHHAVAWTVPLNAAPIAAVGGPYNGTEGTPVTFDASASSDPDRDSLTYRWTFGDGQTTTTSSPTVQHTYVDNRSGDAAYSVGLTVVDPSGASSSAATTATILNAAPTVSVGSPACGDCLGVFTSVYVADLGGAGDGYSGGNFSVNIDFGDGTTWGTSTYLGAFGIQHGYARGGRFTITASVPDKDGAVGIGKSTFTLTQPVSIIASPNSLTKGTKVIKVGMQSTPVFDATLVDKASLRFGNASVMKDSGGNFICATLPSSTTPGLTDMGCQFDRAAIGLPATGTVSVLLTGTDPDPAPYGRPLKGSASVTVK